MSYTRSATTTKYNNHKENKMIAVIAFGLNSPPSSPRPKKAE